MKKLPLTWHLVCMAALTWAAHSHAQSRPNTPAKAPTPAQLEAKRKCPDGPHYSCGELVGPGADVVYQPGDKKVLGKDMPPHERTFGGVRYKIPYSFASALDPTGSGAELVAFWIPLAHYVDGRESEGTKWARESMRLGLLWPYGVRIYIKTNEASLGRRSTHMRCKPNHIDADALPTRMHFDMTQYVDRRGKSKHIADTLCYVSDDPKYEFFPGVPVTYFVSPNSYRGMAKMSVQEVRAEAAFTLHNDKVYVEYLFQTALLPYWKEIHTAVLKLIQSWEQ